MSEHEELSAKHGIPLGAESFTVPKHVAERPVTRVQLIEIVQALEHFTVASSSLALVAATQPDKVNERTDELYSRLAKVRNLLVKLMEE